jgi:prephenate dehydratase
MQNEKGECVARAKELAEAIRDRNNPPSVDAMNRIYDIVLNMNSLNSKPSDGKPNIYHDFTIDVSSLLMEEKKRAVKDMEREAQI